MNPIYRGPWRVDPVVRDGVSRNQMHVAVATLAGAIAAALDAAGAPSPASIGLILSDDAELAGLNRAHLGLEGTTDVLSFPLLPPETFPPHAGDPDRGPGLLPGDAAGFRGPPGRRIHLGDIVVSVERAAEQAAAGRGGQTGDVRWSTADELRLLVTHGALHICGWDHAEPAEESAMRSLEQRLLAGSQSAATRAGRGPARLISGRRRHRRRPEDDGPSRARRSESGACRAYPRNTGR
ncbi:MAG TPA: rRNA maturation RNase YbeY [Candidatus Limnocylindrales bacterium]|nr:rRNA maturation RNase YbeY [Candidatus Limnocylindrales bacterium]